MAGADASLLALVTGAGFCVGVVGTAARCGRGGFGGGGGWCCLLVEGRIAVAGRVQPPARERLGPAQRAGPVTRQTTDSATRFATGEHSKETGRCGDHWAADPRRSGAAGVSPETDGKIHTVG
jgi:hypothetical protein